MPHYQDTQRTLMSERLEFPIKLKQPSPPMHLGWGVHKMIGEFANQLGFKNPLIVTSGLKGTGIIEEVLGILKAAGISGEVYSGVTTNPKDHECMAAYKQLMDANCDGLISIGGGSSHDCAKGVRQVHAHDGIDIKEFEGFETYRAPNKLKLLTCNTTSGTASEISNAWVINNTGEQYKMVTLDPNIVPTLAINDPLLHQTMSKDLAAYTGMDALTHAIEGLTSRLGVRSVWGSGLWAIKTIFSNLRESSCNRDNDEAIENMVWAQQAAGLCFGSNGTGFVHSMAHAMGGLYDSPHGHCNAIGLVNVAEYNLPACTERFKMMAEAIGIDTTSMTAIKAGDAFIRALEELRNDLGITQTFGDLGMKAEDAERMAAIACKDVCTPTNAAEMGVTTAKELLLKSMKKEH